MPPSPPSRWHALYGARAEPPPCASPPPPPPPPPVRLRYSPHRAGGGLSPRAGAERENPFASLAPALSPISTYAARNARAALGTPRAQASRGAAEQLEREFRGLGLGGGHGASPSPGPSGGGGGAAWDSSTKVGASPRPSTTRRPWQSVAESPWRGTADDTVLEGGSTSPRGARYRDAYPLKARQQRRVVRDDRRAAVQAWLNRQPLLTRPII